MRFAAIMGSYRLVIFDFDGTLADSVPWLVEALNHAARQFGFRQIADDEVTRLRGQGNREIIRHLGVPMWKLPLIAASMRRMAAENAGSLSLFPGIETELRRLHAAGIGLAVVSSNTEATIRRVLGADLAALIGSYECGAGIFGKAVKFRKVLRRTRIPATATIAIGDEVRDIEAARAIGIDAGAVTWGYATPDLLRRHTPDILFASVGEVADRLMNKGQDDAGRWPSADMAGRAANGQTGPAERYSRDAAK
jgi:phosphoglycolate phosphatase